MNQQENVGKSYKEGGNQGGLGEQWGVTQDFKDGKT